MNIVYLVASQNKGTILDRMAKEIQRVNGGEIAYVPLLIGNEPFSYPLADMYVCTHYSLVDHALLSGKPIVTIFTHESYPINPRFLNQCKWIITENDYGACLLESKGIKRDIIRIIAECGDNEAFKPHDRKSDGAILICGRNYDTGRKNPLLIETIINLMPNRRFRILGEGWSSSDTCDYKDYPKYYEDCSVYLSCSKLEGGGPNSLIEAMHANIVPVVTDTGNARDYIVHGFNGYIFQPNDSPEKVIELINKAYELNPKENFPFKDVWETVQHFTWKAYGEQWSEYLFS